MLNIDLVTPTGAVLDNFCADFVTLPTVMGEITILPDHTDLVSVLGKGLLLIGTCKKYIIYKGVVEVTCGKKVIIAAERMANPEDLVLDNIKKEITEIEHKIMHKELTEQELAAVMDRYSDLVADLQICSLH